MAQKKQLRLKKGAKRSFTIIVVLFIIVIGICIFFTSQTNQLKKLGYSNRAIKTIMKELKWNDVIAIGENKTVNAAFESKDYQETNLIAYSKITYQDQKDIIKNINTLLSKGYKTNEISLLLSKGNNEDVTEFAKRDKVKYLEEFFSIEYAKLANYDRYIAYQDAENEDAEMTVLHVNLDFDKENYVDPLIISKFNEYTLVNKHRQLSEEYVPNNLQTFEADLVKTEDKVTADASVVKAFKEMAEAASKDDVYLMVNSGYRSYQDQEEIMNIYLKAYGQNYVDNYIAKPGFSEHQTGMSIDVASKSENTFVQSKEYEWMMDNAYLYGFILRYPKSKEEITGYKCEAWHYRYVGKDIAKYIKEHNITYDEYYIQFLDK